MPLVAIDALRARGVCIGDDCARPPTQVTAEDFQAADHVVALKRDEHLPLLQERYPDWTESVEFWDVKDAPEALDVMEREVVALTARLLAGR
jgi:protein-tyrosine-phosphatase